MEDYSLPNPGQGLLLSGFAWERGDEGNEFSLEPGLLVGVLPRLALGVETRFGAEPDEDWAWSSVTPSVHFQLTPPESTFPVRVGIMAGYQFAEDAAHDHGEEEEAEGGEHHDDDHHEESPLPSLIHNHHADRFASKLVLDGNLAEDTKFVVNLLNAVDSDGDVHWGYTAGLRQKFSETFSAGIEARGDFADHGEQEILAGGYLEPVHGFTLKLGAGFGLTEATPDFTLHAGVVLKF